MARESLTLTLFEKHTLEPSANRSLQNHLRQSRLRKRSTQEARELSGGLDDGGRSCPTLERHDGCARLRFVDELAQLYSKAPMTTSRSLGGDLHGDRIEAVFIALRMGADEGFHLFSGRHVVSGRSWRASSGNAQFRPPF